ncbi:hypothetical protein POSPLADRAFT_1115172, partial [Postia placenta MAD-698-R-SB12]
HILVTPANSLLILRKILYDKFKVARGETSGTCDVVRPIAWYGILRSRPRNRYAKQLHARIEIRRT